MNNLFMEDFVELDNLHNEKHEIRGEIRLKQITIDTVSQLTGLTTKQIFRAILHESNLHSRRR